MQVKAFSFFALLQLASAANPLLARAQCNANDCYRQAVASSNKPGHSSATADCSKFLLATVTPCPATATVTSAGVTPTSTVTVTGAAPMKKREAVEIEARDVCTPVTATGSTKPAYASGCANYAAYSSACSCGNKITASTTTLTTATNTVTVSPTATATVVPVHFIKNPNNPEAVGFQDPVDSSLVIGKRFAAEGFYIDSNNNLRHYKTGLYIVARDDSKASGTGAFQYFIGTPESGIIPNVYLTPGGDKLGLSLLDSNYKFCFRDDNGVVAEPENAECRFENFVQYVDWVSGYVPVRA